MEPEETYVDRQLLGKHVSATTPNNGTTVERRCFLLGPPRGNITRIIGQLDSEWREPLETAVKDDEKRRCSVSYSGL
jgi:hypothetical protein